MPSHKRNPSLQNSIKKTISRLTDRINTLLEGEPSEQFLTWLAEEVTHIAKTVELLSPSAPSDDDHLNE